MPIAINHTYKEIFQWWEDNDYPTIGVTSRAMGVSTTVVHKAISEYLPTKSDPEIRLKLRAQSIGLCKELSRLISNGGSQQECRHIITQHHKVTDQLNQIEHG